jgi:hypothetical protein
MGWKIPKMAKEGEGSPQRSDGGDYDIMWQEQQYRVND